MSRQKGALRGLISIYLGRISLDRCYEYIVTHKSLCQGINKHLWPLIRKTASRANIQLTLEEVTRELQVNRPDVLAVILNTPGGMDWLSHQIDEVKTHLTS